MIQQSAKLLNSTLETAESLRKLMTATAEQLPEYDTVLGMYGVGEFSLRSLWLRLAIQGGFTAVKR